MMSIGVSVTDELGVKDNLIENDKSFTVNFNNPDYRYFVFIYDENKTWFVNNMIGPSGCQNGGFYVKDFQENTIRQLVKMGTDISVYIDDNGYICFISENKIFIVDYLGSFVNLLYAATNKLANTLCINGDYIYFAEGNILKRIYLTNLSIESFDNTDVKEGICFEEDGDVINYWNNNDEYIGYNLKTGESSIIQFY